MISFGLTSGLLISRMPHIHRIVRLSLYSLTFLSLYCANKEIENRIINENFNNVTIKLIEAKELKRLYRAYQIKKAEAEEDKKALAKYKFDA